MSLNSKNTVFIMKEEIRYSLSKFAETIARCAQLASLLEVSAWPKPGNVHRLADFHDTKYEHFLCGAVALAGAVRKAVYRGCKIRKENLPLFKANIGKLIYEAINHIRSAHKGGNTHLGTIMLFIPLAVSIGAYFPVKRYFPLNNNDFSAIRENIRDFLSATTVSDSIYFYRAIRSVCSVDTFGNFQKDKMPSIFDKNFEEKLKRRRTTLYEVLEYSSEYDLIAKELLTGMSISFEQGYPLILKLYKKYANINMAVVHTYLTLLSKHVDTLVARKLGLREACGLSGIKLGLQRAKWICDEASRVLDAGGLLTKKGTRLLAEFDEKLREENLNPGSVADITANSIFILLLTGLKF